MKRIHTFLILILMTGVVGAQTVADTTQRFGVEVGLSAGATLYGNGNDCSPYYSKYGFTVQIPILMHYDLSSHWRFYTGLRYDFNWDPLYNGVSHYEVFNNDGISVSGLIPNNNIVGAQHAHIFHSYIGIPLKFTWYPNADDKRLFGLSFDIFGAYAVSQYYNIGSSSLGVASNNSGNSRYYPVGDDENEVADGSMYNWKLEIGLTFSTDYLGIIHGIRIFGDILPRYKDATTGQDIRMVGVTMYL